VTTIRTAVLPSLRDQTSTVISLSPAGQGRLLLLRRGVPLLANTVHAGVPNVVRRVVCLRGRLVVALLAEVGVPVRMVSAHRWLKDAATLGARLEWSQESLLRGHRVIRLALHNPTGYGCRVNRPTAGTRLAFPLYGTYSVCESAVSNRARMVITVTILASPNAAIVLNRQPQKGGSLEISVLLRPMAFSSAVRAE